jgi:hypothetical protein
MSILKRAREVFENQLDSGRISAQDIWGASAVSGIGESYEKQSTRKIDESNIFDRFAPSIDAYVVSAQNSRNVSGIIEITCAVKKVEAHTDALHVWNLPSGACVMPVMRKLKSSAKVAMPTVVADECGIMVINAMITVSVNCAKNGPRQCELTVAHLPVGREITLSGLSFNAATSKSGNFGVYGNAKGIEISTLAIPNSAIERESTLFGKLMDCPGVCLQTVRSMFGTIGTISSDSGVVSNIRKSIIDDAISLRDNFVALTAAVKGHRVGLKEQWEADALSVAALESITEAISNIENMLNNLEKTPVRSIFQFFPLSTLHNHSIPIISFGAEPSLMRKVEAHKHGIGPSCVITKCVPDEVDKKVNVLEDAIIKPSPTMIERALNSSKDQTAPGAVSIDVAAFAMVCRNTFGDEDSSWDHFLPTLADGTTIVSRVIKIATRVGFFKDKLGVYDGERYLKTFIELCQYANQLYFVKTPIAYEPCITDRPHKLPDDDWAGANYTNNYFGVAGAVSLVGVQVTNEFVLEYGVNKYGVVSVKDDYLQIGEKLADGTGVQPGNPPKLHLHGYCALNGVKGLNFQETVDGGVIDPKNDTIKFYAVFEGCAAVVANDKALNHDAQYGAEWMVKGYKQNRDTLHDDVANDIVLYAVVVSRDDAPSEAVVVSRDDAPSE